MTTLHKIGAAILAALLLFGAGWFSRGKEIQTVQLPPQVVTKTETQVQMKVVQHTVTKVVTKVVKAKDGTSTTTVTQETTADQTKDKGREKTTNELQPVGTQQPARPDWSVGVKWQPRFDPAVYYPTQAEIGRRVLGDAWLTLGADWHNHDVTAGVRYDF